MFDLLYKNFSKEHINRFFTFDIITNYLSQLILVVFVWFTIYGIYGDDAIPFSGPLFQLVAIFFFSYIIGEVMLLFNLPPLLGMLITGVLLGNIFKDKITISEVLATNLRNTALVIILLRAGLELDPKKILSLSGVCLRLSFSPCIVETITVAISSHILLSFPLEWGFLLGFVLAAVSPAVVVSGVIPLKENGYGIDKGIPTILMAASSVDDILAISGVMLCLKIVFDTGSPLIWTIIQGPIESIVGVMYGLVFGLILWYLPQDRISVLAERQRVLALLLVGVFVKFVSALGHMDSIGPLAALVTAFVAAIDWRSNKINKPIQNHMKTFWTVFQPILFALIGTKVQLTEIDPGQIVFGLFCLFIGLCTRSVTAMSVVYGVNLNLKEKVFIAMAWLPKATVQAAVGPLALDMAKASDDPDGPKRKMADLVLTIAVLSILITAPLGSVAIALCGPKLLAKSEKTKSITSDTKRSLFDEEDDDEDD